jgi:glutaminyl-peptide cyclotransferase
VQGRAISLRLLAIALAVQLLLGGAFIWAAATGFSFLGHVHSARLTAVVPAPRVDRFDERHAWTEVVGEVSFGPRPSGSAALRRLAELLRARLPNGRFEPYGTGRERNIVGVLPGKRPAVAIVAHYDTSDVPGIRYVGANDGAGGAAAVLEIARSMRRIHRPAGAPELRFVLFDGEEPPPAAPAERFYDFGVRGSRAYAAAHARELRAVILLDFVANQGLRIPRELGSNACWWDRLRTAAARVGESVAFPDRTFPEILDDHTPFTRVGIPAIDLIDFNYPCHDKPCDVPSSLSQRSLDAAGEAVVQMLLGRL